MVIILLTLQSVMTVVWSVTTTASQVSVKTDPAKGTTKWESPQRALAPPAAILIVELPPFPRAPRPSDEATYLPYFRGLACFPEAKFTGVNVPSQTPLLSAVTPSSAQASPQTPQDQHETSCLE